METIVKKITKIHNCVNDIQEAINEKGIIVANDVPLSLYANKIREIETNSNTNISTWQPNIEWWKIRNIIENDTTKNNYACSYISLVVASDVTTSLTGADAYKTSDGAFYNTSTASHTWDSSQDKANSNNYKTRYIIYYFNNQTITRVVDANTIYVVFERCLINVSNFFSNKTSLQAIEAMNGADLSPVLKSMQNMFRSCYMLEKIPMLNTSNINNMSYAFMSTGILKTIPLYDTSNVTNADSTFNACGVVVLPAFDFRKIIDMNMTIFGCKNLTTIQGLDVANVTSTIELTSMQSLLYFAFYNLNTSLIIGSTLVSQAVLENQISLFPDRTGKTQQTFNIGAVNLAKVSQNYKNLATIRNWKLV